MTVRLTNPQPADLGFASPALGPWFDVDKRLGAPDNDLAVAVSFAADEKWLPPSAGLLSLFIAEPDRPYHIAGLRKPDGAPAFSDGRIVAVFRLLPQVEERLNGLMRCVPAATGAAPASGATPTAAAAPTRARVRAFALELPTSFDPASAEACLTSLGNLIGGLPSYVGRDRTGHELLQAKAAYLGLDLPNVSSGGSTPAIRSGSRPMFDLKRPGRFELPGGIGSTPPPEFALRFSGSTSVRLFVFDANGFPLDPGAVAAWWNFLATAAFDNLWAQGFSGADRRTASLDGGARFTVHLTNPHQGALPNDHPLISRAQIAGVETLPSDGPLNLRVSAAGDIRFTFASAPDTAADNAPFPLVAALPDGRFAATLNLWPTGWATSALNRDFLQVALADVESHLVGVSRTLPASVTDATQRRRAADQNRPSTRVNVVRAAGTVLRPTTDSANQSLLDVFDGAGAGTLVTSAADREYGDLAALSGLPAGSPPDSLPTVSGDPPAGAQALTDPQGRRVGIVHPLIGGANRALIELALGAALAGAWVRAWTQDFDPTTGSRKRMDGGSGRADSSGRVLIAVKLEEGATGTPAPAGVDLFLKTADGGRAYMDLRFVRPAPVTGSALALSAAANIVICETGQTLPSAGLADAIPSGAILIAPAEAGRANPTLIDPASIPAAAFSTRTLIRKLASGDALVLNQPAFVGQPDGNIRATLDGITVQRFVRNALERISDGSVFASGAPLPSQERLEVVAARVDTSSAQAALATSPALGLFHELLPHQQGHPGAPGAAEYHGAGATLSGAAALPLAEYVRDRRERTTPSLIEQAFNTPFPEGLSTPAAADPAQWIAALRTVGAGTEGEPGVALLIDTILGTDTTPGTIARDVERWIRNRNIDATPPSGTADLISALNAALGALPALTGDAERHAVESAARALDRRLQAARGLREGAISLLAALRRAEDFIYIETPAVDTLACGTGGEEIRFWPNLVERMTDRAHRALKLILCVPLRFSPFAPAPLQTVRDAGLKAALDALRSLAHFDQRVAIITPNAGPGRTLFLASTTVIVDDAYLFMGSTHLWRRGLSFDSSLSISLFDETLEEGRPAAIRRFRRDVIAARLGLAPDLMPENATDLLEAMRLLPGRDGGRRLTTRSVQQIDATATTTDQAIWSPDASPGMVFNIATFLATLAAIRPFVPPTP